MKQINSALSAVALLAFVLAAPHARGQTTYTPYTFTTLAGNTGYGSADGTNSAARFAAAEGVAVDANGNVYVTDSANDTIRKVTPVGTNWVVTTLAGLAGNPGSADGTNSAARFNNPASVAVDSAGNLYVSDHANSTIRKVTPVGTNWVVTTLAGLAGSPGTNDGTGSAARFNTPWGVAVDTNGNVYVADAGNNTIREVTPVGTNWVVTTLAVAGQFSTPWGVAVDTNGNVYVADTGNNRIREVTPDGVVTTLATGFYDPVGVAMDGAGNLYVGDWGNSTIREVTPDGVVTTIAGLARAPGHTDGTNSDARFDKTYGVAVDTNGNVYVADTGNNTIREVTPVGTDWVVTTLAGLAVGGPGSADGMGRAAQFNSPLGPAVDSAGNLYVADLANDTLRKVTAAGVVTTLAGLAGVPGSADGTNSDARFDEASGVAVDINGNLYVADWGNHTIRKVTPVGTNWVVTTLAGEAGNPGFADGSPGQFGYPNGVAVDTNGNVFVADYANGAIREVTPAGAVTTLSTDFSGPTGVAVDTNGNVYVADFYSDTIRELTPAGGVTILAGLPGVPGSADGTNADARFNHPYAVAVDSNGNVYVADEGNNMIRKVTPVGTNWVVTTLAGVAGFGSADGTGSAAQFTTPQGVAVDNNGNVYVADQNNNTIRKGFPASSVPAPLLQPPSLSAGQFGFGITGLPNLAVDIESSGDLSQWQLAGTVILEGGTNSFFTPKPPQGTQFYRGHVR